MTSQAMTSENFNLFLFETLRVEDNGMDLTVLSALARAGYDPWAEAKRLATLPRPMAIDALFELTQDADMARQLARALPRIVDAAAVDPRLADRQAMFRRYGFVVIIAWLFAAVGVMMVVDPQDRSAPTAISANIATVP